MKFAIIADIHGNLEAFQAVLADARDQRCNRFAFLGDFVGYYADPKACLDIVRSLNAPCVKGNYDHHCAADVPLTDFNPRAAKAIQWTRKQLTEDDCQWLRNLPLISAVEGFSIVHANFDHPEHWGYVFEKTAAASSLAQQPTPVTFFGHTHVPIAFVRDTVVRGGTYTKFTVDAEKRYFVNPGAVGQPRDGNPSAAYVVYDVNERTIELRRVAYDIEAAQKKVQQAGI